MKKFFKTNFKVGSLTLKNNIFYASLAGCTDVPFRKISLKYNPGLQFCEMVKTDAVIRHDKNTFRFLDFSDDMHPIGAQLCGSNPKIAMQAAKIIEDLGFDLIDLNCGCPVDKVIKDGSGSGMLKNPELIGEVLEAITSSVNLPVTVKIRAGWDEESINAVAIAKIAKKANAKAITVHGRTRKQKYKGLANWDYIKEVKEQVKDILVLGNGDVFCSKEANDLFEHTNCDGIVLARGILGQPWLVEDIFQRLSTGIVKKKTGLDVFKVLMEHFYHVIDYQIEKKAVLDMRRVGCWYLKRCLGTKCLRIAINQAKSSKDIISFIKDYDWQKVEFLEKVARGNIENE